jgi:hypothetical protein
MAILVESQGELINTIDNNGLFDVFPRVFRST